MAGARVLPAVLVVLAAVLAGCVGHDPPGGKAVNPSGGLESSDPGLGSVEGIVVDDQGLPVEGAGVALTDVDSVATTTGTAGNFFLANIPPGGHNLVVTMIGFESAQRPFHLEAAQKVEGLEIQLRPSSKPVESYVELVHDNGFISCNVSTIALPFTRNQICAFDSKNKPFIPFDVSVPKGLVSVVAEIRWTSSTPGTASELRLGIWKNITCANEGSLPATLSYRCSPEEDIMYAAAQGQSPVKAQVGTEAKPFRDGLDLRKTQRLGAIALIRSWDSPSVQNPTPDGITEPVALVVQQPVEFFVSIFYNKAPGPDYSALPA
jgi:hypothetical protein